MSCHPNFYNRPPTLLYQPPQSQSNLHKIPSTTNNDTNHYKSSYFSLFLLKKLTTTWSVCHFSFLFIVDTTITIANIRSSCHCLSLLYLDHYSYPKVAENIKLTTWERRKERNKKTQNFPIHNLSLEVAVDYTAYIGRKKKIIPWSTYPCASSPCWCVQRCFIVHLVYPCLQPTCHHYQSMF